MPLLTPSIQLGCRAIEQAENTAVGCDYGHIALHYATHLIFKAFDKAKKVFKLGFDEQTQFGTNFERLGWFISPDLRRISHS